MTRRAWALFGVVGAFAMGCAPETGTAGEILEVECIGMARFTPLAGLFRLESPGNARCVGLMSDTTWGGDIEIYDAQTYGQPNGMTLQVTYGDEVWTSRAGAITIPEVLEDRGAGTFDVTATNEAGETLRIRGPIDFCDYVTSEDCPYGFDSADLPFNVRFDYGTEEWGSQDDTYATECRAVIDTATGGLQVDLQLGVWRGRNIALYQVDCDRAYSTMNSFRFQSGGVTGPGSYGPWTTTANGGTTAELPAFSLGLPLVYYGFSCFSDYDNQIITSAAESLGTSCSFDVEEGDPYGRFALNCTNAGRYYNPGGNDTVDFNLETACTVIVQ